MEQLFYLKWPSNGLGMVEGYHDELRWEDSSPEQSGCDDIYGCKQFRLGSVKALYKYILCIGIKQDVLSLNMCYTNSHLVVPKFMMEAFLNDNS